MFMFRNTIELCLKRLFYSRVEKGVTLKYLILKGGAFDKQGFMEKC